MRIIVVRSDKLSRRGGCPLEAQSQHPDTHQEILMLLRRPTGTSWSCWFCHSCPSTLSATTYQSSIERPPSSSGILSWILDSGASFDVTPDNTRLLFALLSFLSLFKLLMAHLFWLLVVALFHLLHFMFPMFLMFLI